MGSYSGSCEIVEVGEELGSAKHSRGFSSSYLGSTVGGSERKPPKLKQGYKEYLQDDINQLFEAISLKKSSKYSGLSNQSEKGMSPLRKDFMKRPIAVSAPHSPRTGISEPVSLKQALRELCLSKASEMAAMKRLSRSSTSLGVSEAERIKGLYSSVVVETGRSGQPHLSESRRNMVQAAFVPEESKSISSSKMPQHLQIPKMKSVDQSAQSSPRFQMLKSADQSAQSSPRFQMLKSADQSAQSSPRFQMLKSADQSAQSSPRFQMLKSADQSAQSSPRFQALKLPIQSTGSSPRFAVPKAKGGAWTNSMQNEGFSGSRKVVAQALKSSNQSEHSSPRFHAPPTQDRARNTSMHDTIASASKKVGIQASKSPNQSTLSSPKFGIPKVPVDKGTRSMHNNQIVLASREVGSKGLKSPMQSVHSSPRLVVREKENVAGTNPMQNDIALSAKKAGTPALKTEIRQKKKHSPATFSSTSVDNCPDSGRKVPTSTKVGIKLSPSKSGRRGRFLSTHSSLNGNRLSKLRKSSSNSAKLAIRTKTSIRKKTKQGGASSAASIPIELNSSLALSTGQLICHKCHCTLKNVMEEPDEDSPVSFPASLSAEVSSGIVYSVADPDFALSSCDRNKNVGKAKRISKSREKGEFSQSSKSSLGDFSTSTSNSDKSSASRSSWSNRPHMSKDFRWQAIRHVKMQDGGLSLEHFNLLKKLGSGDIGTVYLAELIGSNCLFALKVMDNEFLARRKKMPRAQTEREILRMLDHPFLPTLYAQFTSDNLSCLVMEYCPGGDLHVLRQKQPARSFPEPAARFYVAEVLLALEYLHMLGIIYRDLKPENILVREDGHIMLTDFDLSLQCSVNPTLLQLSSTNLDPARISGQCTESSCMQPFCIERSGKVSCFSPRLLPPTTAKARKIKAELAAQIRSLPQLVAEPTDARSNSFVGTHEYLAPEIIKGDGHGAAVDWWTFGILLYELLYGKTPFKGSVNDETLANVVLQGLKFPDTPLVSFQARDLIRRLLVKEPEYRLGTEKGAAEIKQHPFFEGLNWALIRCAIPPEVPEFYETGVLNMTGSQGKDSSGYLECQATGDHLEFELF